MSRARTLTARLHATPRRRPLPPAPSPASCGSAGLLVRWALCLADAGQRRARFRDGLTPPRAVRDAAVRPCSSTRLFPSKMTMKTNGDGNGRRGGGRKEPRRRAPWEEGVGRCPEPAVVAGPGVPRGGVAGSGMVGRSVPVCDGPADLVGGTPTAAVVYVFSFPLSLSCRWRLWIACPPWLVVSPFAPRASPWMCRWSGGAAPPPVAPPRPARRHQRGPAP